MGMYSTLYVDFENAVEHWLQRAIEGNRRWCLQGTYLIYNNGMCGVDNNFDGELEKVLAKYPLKLNGPVMIQSWSTYGPGVFYRETMHVVNSVLYNKDRHGLYYPMYLTEKVEGDPHCFTISKELYEKHASRELPPKQDLLLLKN